MRERSGLPGWAQSRGFIRLQLFLFAAGLVLEAVLIVTALADDDRGEVFRFGPYTVMFGFLLSYAVWQWRTPPSGS